MLITASLEVIAAIGSSSDEHDEYTISQLAKTTDTKAVTVCYYEQPGLLPSAGARLRESIYSSSMTSDWLW